MSRRTERIAAQIMEEVARLLREDVSDPRVGLVTLTRVDVAPDLSNAVVHYSAMGAEGADTLSSIDDGLSSAAPFLRRRAAQVLPLRRMPELRFRYDPSLSLGSKTLDLLREIAEDGTAADDRGTDPTPEPTEPEPDGEAR